MLSSIFRSRLRPSIRLVALSTAFLATQLVTMAARASDPVLDWIAIANDTVIAAASNPLVTSRVLSLTSASVFDAVNGTDPRYQPVHVRPNAPRHASPRAAAIQAAYATLIRFYPAFTASTMTDALIACWDAKYRYVFWRPITAIRAGDTDGNASTDPDPAWTPWLDFFPSGTPSHPEYPSGHSTVSGSAAAILSTIFGDNTAFTVASDVRPGTRAFASFSSAVAEIADARVFGGIHFRISCVRGNALGQAIAGYVSSHAMRPED